MSLAGRADGAGFVTSEVQFVVVRPLPVSSSPVSVLQAVQAKIDHTGLLTISVRVRDESSFVHGLK
jgi:hypothetical protein